MIELSRAREGVRFTFRGEAAMNFPTTKAKA